METFLNCQQRRVAQAKIGLLNRWTVESTDNSTWRSMAWCAGMLSGNLATCPNMALQSDDVYILVRYIIDGDT